MTIRARARRFRRAFLFSLLLPLCPATPAQTTCFDTGSIPIAAAVLAHPLPISCPGAPAWPLWHLWTPAHRALAPHPGYAPGDSRALAVVLIPWECTGHLLQPFRPGRIRTMGYVLDTPEAPC